MLSRNGQANAWQQQPDHSSERILHVCSRADTRPAWLIKAQSGRVDDRNVPVHQIAVHAIANARIAGSQIGATTHARRME
ncbi:hypothetical protein MPL3356_60598 [Mesorhizobium plurifarium]|uniref:Uncharacterized protein n=1 Tax=Mesorhizobium plurifarium TaxID=69974 RepID=A0A090EFH0_MESPL|nr:hypothetical protein MPL3356_60598 [Mesorhizobium plurifarium]